MITGNLNTSCSVKHEGTRVVLLSGKKSMWTSWSLLKKSLEPNRQYTRLSLVFVAAVLRPTQHVRRDTDLPVAQFPPASRGSFKCDNWFKALLHRANPSMRDRDHHHWPYCSICITLHELSFCMSPRPDVWTAPRLKFTLHTPLVAFPDCARWLWCFHMRVKPHTSFLSDWGGGGCKRKLIYLCKLLPSCICTVGQLNTSWGEEWCEASLSV